MSRSSSVPPAVETSIYGAILLTIATTTFTSYREKDLQMTQTDTKIVERFAMDPFYNSGWPAAAQ